MELKMSAPNSGGHLNERLYASLKQLSSAAANLNRISDEFGEAINIIDIRLGKLNLGLSAWVTFEEGDDNGRDLQFCHQIGYTRLPGRRFPWGIGIRTVVAGDDDEVIKAFNEAPRELRLKSITKFPDLIDLLAKEVTTKLAEIVPCAEQGKEFASVLTSIVGIPDDEVPF
jgi:hypothetical protein